MTNTLIRAILGFIVLSFINLSLVVASMLFIATIIDTMIFEALTIVILAFVGQFVILMATLYIPINEWIRGSSQEKAESF